MRDSVRDGKIKTNFCGIGPLYKEGISQIIKQKQKLKQKIMLTKALIATIVVALQSVHAVNLTLDLES